MANAYRKICRLYPTADDSDFTLKDNSDGNGAFLDYWNTTKLGAEPTLASLDAQISDEEIISEYKWGEIRKERNQLLKDSDYTMLKDYPTTVSEQEWTTYRQSLRDIPQTFSNPDDVTYPDKPE